MNKEISKKIDEIISDIENSSVYQEYLSLREKIKKDKELMELINRVRLMQKDFIHKKKSKEELDKLISELNNHPLYREYNNVVYEINNTYGIIESSLNNYFDRIIN